MDSVPAMPRVSVVILNYNGARWNPRCLQSLRAQTIFGALEVVFADNASTDGSDRSAGQLLASWPNATFIQHPENLGYCEGNNRAARAAAGRYLFFLNNDTWLEPDCLEKLLGAVGSEAAAAAMPLVMDYEGDRFQSLGAAGFDLFGFTSTRLPHPDIREVFMPEGCAFLVERGWFERLGGFDPRFFLYSDEYDLSFRLWLAGGRAIAVPGARLHHRGAAFVNPQGGQNIVELRTSDRKRFFANRNGLLVVLKNGQHLLLLLLPLQLALLAVEALAGLCLVRRWSFVRQAYAAALADCWRLRRHVAAERRRIRGLRRRSDFWMLRFLRMRLNRWDELCRVRRLGVPRVTAG